MRAMGKVFLVGGGPGDPELITAKGIRRLAQADVVLYDALIHEDLLLHCRPDAERVFVGKRAGRTSERQADINLRLVEAARTGATVVRLKGGDPYLFGRGSEEAEFLAEHGVPFEVVPGVPSPLAATAYAGISLSHRDLASSMAFITATESEAKDASTHDWPRLATATQTLVIFMGLRKLDSLMERLMSNGRPPDCPAAVIEWASLPRQRTVVGTVADIAERARAAGLGTPALTVVGEVVRLRDTLRWFDTKPLFGKRVLVTRAEAQAPELCRALRDAGAEPIAIPVLRIVPPEDPARLSRAVTDVGSYDWLLFTSANGVEAFFAELALQGADARRLGGVRLGAIGPATATALQSRGLRADVVPESYRGEALAEAVQAAAGAALRGQRVLLARAAQAREVLPEMLRAAGASVDVVPAYRTLPPEAEACEALRALVDPAHLDVVTFTSSSTVTHTLQALGEAGVARLNRLTLASIGPITTQTAESHGLKIRVSADEFTLAGLLDALETQLSETP
jgi:uroporphyrinogen III methyltransferase/synthase